MIYVVKVGDYYVQSCDSACLWEIRLSQTMMRTFPRSIAEEIADKLNGKVISIENEITISEDEEK